MAQSILVVAAHPDDEVVGVGGTIAKHAAAGESVHVLFVTDGQRGRSDPTVGETRRSNARECADRLGVESCHFGELPDTELDQVAQRELNQVIEDAIERVTPALVYTHAGNELHADHRAVHESTLVATRPASGVETVLAYEIPTSTNRRDFILPFRPTTHVGIDGTLDTKLEALTAYDGETEDFPHCRSVEFVRHHARYRGGLAGMQAAEAFQLLADRVDAITDL